MTPIQAEAPNLKALPSPLMLCDRLITLAKDADEAGYAVTASQLVELAQTVLEEKRHPSWR
jgi:hypothetical protein